MKSAVSTVLVLLTWSSAASAQSIAISDSGGQAIWFAPQGGTIVVTGKDLVCDATKGEPVLTFSTHPVDAVRVADGKWTVTVPSDIGAQAHQIDVACGDAKASRWLTVIPARAIVVCARNRTPKPTEKKPVQDKCGSELLWEVREHDQIELEVFKYDELVKQPDVGTKPLRLFIGGIELGNLSPRVSRYDPEKKRWTLWTQLDFDDKDESNRKAWVQLLQRARDNEVMDISIGPQGGPQWPTTATLAFDVYPTGWAGFTGVVIAVLLIGIVVLAARSSLLRGPACATGPAPYSLARHQMAVWFVVVLAAYLFLILLTGRAATSSTALILIGISGATGLAAVVIDAQQAHEATRDSTAVVAEEAALRDALDNPQTGLRAQLANAAPGSTEAAQISATIQTKMQRLGEVTTLLQQVKVQQSPSRGWVRDILSDENGISFHRLQIVGWTVVLVGVFARAVWRDFAMPEFDVTTLALMGVSSGTYLGFKLPK